MPEDDAAGSGREVLPADIHLDQALRQLLAVRCPAGTGQSQKRRLGKHARFPEQKNGGGTLGQAFQAPQESKLRVRAADEAKRPRPSHQAGALLVQRSLATASLPKAIDLVGNRRLQWQSLEGGAADVAIEWRQAEDAPKVLGRSDGPAFQEEAAARIDTLDQAADLPRHGRHLLQTGTLPVPQSATDVPTEVETDELNAGIRRKTRLGPCRAIKHRCKSSLPHDAELGHLGFDAASGPSQDLLHGAGKVHGAREVDRAGKTGVPDPPRGFCRVEIRLPDVDAEQHGNLALGLQLFPSEAFGQAAGLEDRQHAGDGWRPHVAQPPGIDGEQKVRAAALGRQGHAARADRRSDKELP